MNYNIITNQDSLGALWCIGWLFTIGYLKLTFWKGVLALFIWPYYMGRHFSKIHTKAVEHKTIASAEEIK